MSKNEFDDWLIKRLQEEELEYKPEHWQQMSRKLPPVAGQTRKFSAKWQAIAAGVAALLLLATGWAIFMPQPTTDTPVLVNTGTPTPHHTPSTAVPSEQTIQEPETNTTPKPSLLSPIHSGTHQAAPIMATEEKQYNPLPAMPEEQVPAMPLDPATKRHDDISNKDEGLAHKEAPARPLTPGVQPFPSTEPFIPAQVKKQTILSVGGGVNYGTVNTGYTVALSARRELGNDFFVDGTVAMMYNNNTSNINNYNQGAVQSAARPLKDGQMISSPALNPAANQLYYLQVNPTFGYKIDKDIALSVGGDVQQMLNTPQPGEVIVSTAEALAKVLPTLDIGITAKSEFDIAPNIQAGLLYREGLNNYFSNSRQYFNRRYFQVQFKYSIPLK